jgi:transcription initiation factor TFIID subunit 5
MDFSGDNELVAVGTAESYIRVWSMDGKPLPAAQDPSNADPSRPTVSASRRLIGHSGPVYAVSFSPSTANSASTASSLSGISTASRHLLSASADKTIRLWSLDTYTTLVIYKGHDQPVWDVTWGPFGHYFLSGGHDNTARIWSTDNIAPLRMLVGHDQDVDCVAFHPNNAYVFTGSSDKTVRMWDVSRGTPVRMFTGHTSNITAIACAPSGRTLASADDTGAILLWDLASGKRSKRMRGHGRGGIWSLTWSVESSLLTSAGADGTVRVWDAVAPGEGQVVPIGGKGGQADAGASSANMNGVLEKEATKKRPNLGPTMSNLPKLAAKEGGVTPDQISAFATKKSPVYKVKFTNMNLVVAGGCYMP